MTTVFLLMLCAAAENTSTPDLQRIAKAAPRTNPQLTSSCRRARREWTHQQYGSFHGELVRPIYQRTVIVRDDYGKRFRLAKSELSEADRYWIRRVQRELRRRNNEARRRRRR